MWQVWSGISLWFEFASLWWLLMLTIFSYVYGPSVYSSWRSVCSYLLPIFNRIICLPGVESWNSFYISEIKSLLDVSLANMFSHRFNSFFILLMVSLTMQKLFSLMQSHFLNFFLYVPYLRRYINKNIGAWDTWNFPACFSL